MAHMGIGVRNMLCDPTGIAPTHRKYVQNSIELGRMLHSQEKNEIVKTLEDFKDEKLTFPSACFAHIRKQQQQTFK